MRILRVAQNLYLEEPGGGTYHVHAMSRDQAAMGHDVTVLTIRRDPSKPSVEQRHGYTVVWFDPIASPLGNDVSLGTAQYLVSDLEFDVVHAHSHLYFSTNLAALRRRLSNTPLAITNHGLYSQNAPKWVFDLYLRSLGRWTFNQADMVFCYTDEDRCRVREFGVDSRIEVVPNDVDTVDHYGNLKGSNRLDDQRLGCQHHGHGAVERAAAFANQDPTPTGQGIDQSYGSEVCNTYLRYMWHNSVMQAALRFGRDPKIGETVIVAHTATLRDDLPVVAEGEVVKTYSVGNKRIADLRGHSRRPTFGVDWRTTRTRGAFAGNWPRLLRLATSIGQRRPAA